MDDRPETYRARRPRYQATDYAAHSLRIERGPMSLPPAIDANLVNLSAMGIRFQAAMPLEVGEPVTIRLSGEASQPIVTRLGTVRWVSPDNNGGWLAGCMFDQRVEWEALGELFLTGVLSTDLPAAPPAETAPTETPAILR